MASGSTWRHLVSNTIWEVRRQPLRPISPQAAQATIPRSPMLKGPVGRDRQQYPPARRAWPSSKWSDTASCCHDNPASAERIPPAHRSARTVDRRSSAEAAFQIDLLHVCKQLRRRTVNNQAHRPFRIMGAHQNAVCSNGIAHAGHHNQQLSSQIHGHTVRRQAPRGKPDHDKSAYCDFNPTERVIAPVAQGFAHIRIALAIGLCQSCATCRGPVPLRCG